MQAAPIGFSRTITATEIRKWFGTSLKPQLSEAQYEDIAAFLTRCRWPGDPPDPPGSPWLIEMIEDDPAKGWDFKRVPAAARTLLDSMPAMVSFWEYRSGPRRDAINKVAQALEEAIECIEWPFGRYERATRQKPLKQWHLYALMIAHSVMVTMIEAGHKDPALTRNSVVARIVQKSLARMKFANARMITTSAIGAHLTRWDHEFGLSRCRIEPLTTK